MIVFLQIEYRIKWLGYPATENTWVPKEDTNCDDLIMEFEKSQLVTIYGNYLEILERIYF